MNVRLMVGFSVVCIPHVLLPAVTKSTFPEIPLLGDCCSIVSSVVSSSVIVGYIPRFQPIASQPTIDHGP